MKTMVIDGDFMATKDLMYAHLNRVFSFPSYFGNNLDALWDVLNEASEPTTVEFTHVNAVVEHLGTYGEKLIELFHKLDEENNCYQVNFYSGDIRPERESTK
ncbi:MAG TPA: barstar family protein [Atopostipes sp.]|jgi:ribonuclease inhibitor|nr:barstar family protein [Atopostipes sp.]